MQRRSFLTALSAAALAGCGLTRGDALALVTSANPRSAARQMLRNRAVGLVQDTVSGELKHFFERLGKLRQAGKRVWGEHDFREPGTRRYVKYTNNYLSRATVDFDRGLVTVETVDPGHPQDSLKSAIVTTLLTPQDPRAVDMYSDRAVELTGTPYLAGEILDHDGQPILYPWRAGRFADYLMANEMRTRKIDSGGGRKKAWYVEIAMVPDHLEVRAAKYQPFVERYAGRYDLSPNLVNAVIKTESDFNPYAVSHVPAFGLMQIVPGTAGRDAYRFLNGTDGVPTQDYLFDPEQNIEMGSAYLYLLHYTYLAEVHDPVSKEYCAIAAYNGGIGNVLESFSRDRSQAQRVIDSLPAGEVYARLQAHMPDEAQRYLDKVLGFKKDFVAV